MRTVAVSAVLVIALGLSACGRRGRDAEPDSGPDTAARKTGRAAYDVAQKAKEAARKAGQEIKQTSHELHEGWKEEKHDAKERGRQ